MWRGKKAGREVHPSVSFATTVQVREFAEEQHHTALHRIRCLSPPPPVFPTLTSTGSCLDEEWQHHSIMIGSESEDSSLACPEESWTEESICLEVEKRLAISEGEISNDYRFREGNTAQEYLEDGDDLQSSYRDRSCKLKDKKEQSHSREAQSFKIKWSFKRKRRKRLRLKVPQRPRKLQLLGDMNCGKSSLITTYCRDRFQERYFPTILHCCYSDAKVMRRRIELILADTPGREDYKPLRKCTYAMTDVAILCYSAHDRKTLDRIRVLVVGTE